MSLVLQDRVRETTAVTGTGSATLLGAVTGYQAFSVIGNTNTCYYVIADQSGPNWEVGIGTYSTTGPTLARTTVLASSNAGSLVNFTSGTKDVFVTQPSEKAVYLDSSSYLVGNASYNIALNGNLGFNSTGARITGDFSNATVANRLAFQTSTTNGITAVSFVPNGTATQSSLNLEGDSALANGSVLTISTGANTNTEARINSTIRGTGTYLPLTMFTGGSERLRIDTSGLIGIGVTPVASKGQLQVGTIGYTDTGIVGAFASSVAGYNQLILQNTSNNAGASANLNISNDAATTSTNFGELGINSSTFTGTGSFSQAGNVYLASASTDLVLGTYASKPIRFVVNSGATDAMVIDSSGNVGVGTSSPSARLHVVDNTSQTNPTLKLSNIAGSYSQAGVSFYTTAQTTSSEVLTARIYSLYTASGFGNQQLRFQTGDGAGALQDRMTIDSNGLVGIGLTPSGTTVKLQVSTDALISGLTVGKGGGAISTNTAVGASAFNATNSGAYGTAIGFQAGTANTSGPQNTFIGGASGPANTTGGYNAAIGAFSFYQNTSGSYNSAFGYDSLEKNTTGSYNTAVGGQALHENTTASNNTAIGYQAGYSNTTGLNNFYGGYQAGLNGTTASYNVAIGTPDGGYGLSAAQTNTTGQALIAIGSGALARNTTASHNNAVGYQSLFFNTTGANNTALGNYALNSNTTASNSTAVGYQAGYANTTGNSIVFMGYQAGYNHTTGTRNTYIGYVTGFSNQTGNYNVAVGSNALYSATGTGYNTAVGDYAMNATSTGSNNTAMGQAALYANTTGSNHTAFGLNSLFTNTTGTANTALGYQTLYSNTTASENTAIGYQTLYANTTGSGNTGLGHAALRLSTTGNYNTALGYTTLYSTTTGVSNTAVGFRPLYTNTTGTGNTALGQDAMYFNTIGGSNVAIGVQALLNNTTASNNTAVGYQAGYSNTTGSVTALGYLALTSNTTGTGNTGLGGSTPAVSNSALQANTTGYWNTAVGSGSLQTNTTGASNTALGLLALASNTTASNNTAVGYQASYSSTTGAVNTAIGNLALYSNTTGSSNTAVGYQANYTGTAGGNTCLGYQAGWQLTTGDSNVLLGYGAGAYSGNNITTGSGNIVIGSYTNAAAASTATSITIGYNVVGKGTNTGFIAPNGSASTGVYQGNNSAAWAITSDQRLKKNIVDNTVGLDAINAIQVRNFEYRTADEVTELPKENAIDIKGIQLGAIAQELAQVLPDCVKTESTGVMSVDTTNITWHLINAVKELNAKVEAQALEIATLKGLK